MLTASCNIFDVRKMLGEVKRTFVIVLDFLLGEVGGTKTETLNTWGW